VALMGGEVVMFGSWHTIVGFGKQLIKLEKPGFNLLVGDVWEPFTILDV